MASKRRILITGIGTHWGTELALRLELDDRVEQVIGIDTTPPLAELERTEFIEADIRSPLLARLLPTTGVDTVVHAGILWYPEPGKPSRALHDINVIGTLQLLAACERLPTLERVVVRGSAAIYGCEPTGPSFFTEDMAAEFPLRTRFQRDIGELESYFENFARRHSRLTCCMLRFQPEIGPGPRRPDVELPLASGRPDPARLRPAAAARPRRRRDRRAARGDAWIRSAGAVNVAPSGSISLARALRLIDRPQMPIPHPLFAPAMARLGERLGAGSLYGDAVRLLRYGRGVDNSRLRNELGYEPRYDAVSAIRDFAAADRGLRLVLDPGGRIRPRADWRGRADERDPIRPSIPEIGVRFLRGVRTAVDGGLDPLSAAEAASADLPKSLRDAIDRMARRMRGDYHEDEWGFDEEFAEAAYPFFELLYDQWWRVEATGVENVPAHGRAMLVSNHAGAIFPFDASMITGAIMKEHVLPRWPRFMVLDWAFSLPVPLGVHAQGRRGSGQPLQRDADPRVGRPDDGLPGGREGHGQAVRRALPAAAVRPRRIRRGGAANRLADRPDRRRRLRGDLPEDRRQPDARARLSARPYAPITPTFPWLGPLGLIPLPSKWRIEFCDPIDVSSLGPEAAEDRQLVFEISEQVRETIQQKLYENLVKRGSAFV